MLTFSLQAKQTAVAAFIFLLLLPGIACKKIKAAAGDRSAQEALFEENLLNRDFVVHLAIDEGNDITPEFAGYNFVLTKTTSFYEGQLTGSRNGVVYTGTWACNEDFSKLTININNPSVPPFFEFLNRAWKFTKKGFPIMELAPWGSTASRVLHMERL
jgi:hypothetical protein